MRCNFNQKPGCTGSREESKDVQNVQDLNISAVGSRRER